jgi:hypothetical protein
MGFSLQCMLQSRVGGFPGFQLERRLAWVLQLIGPSSRAEDRGTTISENQFKSQEILLKGLGHQINFLGIKGYETKSVISVYMCSWCLNF